MAEETVYCSETGELEISAVTEDEETRHKQQISTENFLLYEKQMLQDTAFSDALVVAAKGISYEKSLVCLIKTYADPQNLIFIMNFSDSDLTRLKVLLWDCGNVYEASSNVNERKRTYNKGGVHLVTTRILVVDLLMKRIPIEFITGIIVLKAHEIIESCQEAFALQLYRKFNKTGFIKAFSSKAEAFTFGYTHLEKAMRNMFVNELYIWPRFHALVQASLKGNEIQAFELNAPATDRMVQMQHIILEILNSMVKEIKRINPSVDLEEITVENCVSKYFHKILKVQLDCIWHQLNNQTKLLISDLKILRNIILSLFYKNSLKSYDLIMQYRTKEYAMNNSGWVLSENADKLFKLAKDRVFNSEGEFEPEAPPKWATLEEIINVEIPGMLDSSQNTIDKQKVLILCEDIGTSYQLQQLLTQGSAKLLLMEALKYNIKVQKISEKLFKKTSKVRNEQIEEDIFENPDEFLETIKESFLATQNAPEYDHFETTLSVLPEPEKKGLSKDFPLITIQTLKSEEDRDECILLDEIICRIQPQFIILYHYNVSAVRQIESLEARQRRKADDRFKVFFMIHPNTIEEQAYLTSLRREKQAFQLLIETKKTMVIPEDQDGKSEEYEDIKDSQTFEQPSVIVDMREFRSQLPCLLFRKGIEVLPVTITVGDYILTPDICVERKSIPDLVGSLNSGRLYSQSIQMHRNYQTPILLIEFDQYQPFHLQGLSLLSTHSSGPGTSVNTAIMQKLQLLTIHFPKLKLIWSPSPYASALLIENIKKKKPQPDPKMALKQGTEEADGGNAAGLHIDKYNSNVFDFMIRMPGISYRNINKVMNRKLTFKEFVNMKTEEIEEVMDSKTDADAFLTGLNFSGAKKSFKSGSGAGSSKHSRYRNIC